jgi:large subunit GTPase 1
VVRYGYSSFIIHLAQTVFHTTDLNDGYDWAQMGSVTEQGDLDDFLSTAALAGTDFAAEKLNVTFVTAMENEALLGHQKQRELQKSQRENAHRLRIPRRPTWYKGMGREALFLAERESFVAWRRNLAALQEVDSVVLTPFERNIEFWRQLWRVIERSNLVVQIVDARNPLLFRCPDVDTYVGEMGEQKGEGLNNNKDTLLLLNKADLLTPDQRCVPAHYTNLCFVR